MASGLMSAHLEREVIPVSSELEKSTILSIWGQGDAWCLGHAFDGVLWGRIRDGVLRFSSDLDVTWGARFRSHTLSDLRVFNHEQELRFWRDGKSMRAARIGEAQGESVLFRDQDYLLIHQPDAIGNVVDGEFVRLDGIAGQRHYPPGGPIPNRLRVRTYFRADATGILRTFEHRAMELVGKDVKRA